MAEVELWEAELQRRERENVELWEAELQRRALVKQYRGVEWAEWLFEYLPNHFSNVFADEHVEFWEAIEQVPPSGLGQPAPDPVLSVLPRGYGKSTELEAACVRLGAKKKRRFILYVSGIQMQADDHLRTISQMLRSPRIAQDYPEIANPKIETPSESRKQTRQLGWNQTRLWTEGGFAVASLGLDSAMARGFKLEDQRPDAIVLDDIDAKQDTPATVEKKIKAITETIIPAGSADRFVFGGQNLVHKNSIFSKLVEGDASAEFLLKRRMIGPVPALRDLKIGKDDEGRNVITGGTPTWPGMNLEKCKAEAELIGLNAWRVENQHETDLDAGLFLAGIWSSATHVLPLAGFDPPRGWRITRAFDWGSRSPYAAVWVAFSDGSPCTMAGRERFFPRGTAFVLTELYGWSQKPNQGVRHSDAQMALAIREHQRQFAWADRVQRGVADGQIFSRDNNKQESIHDRMVAASGMQWTEADKTPNSRINGAAAIVNRLRASLSEPPEKPGLYVASSCRQIIRTFPALPSDPKKPEDIDTDSEDHLWDALRYVLYAKPQKSRRVKVKFK